MRARGSVRPIGVPPLALRYREAWLCGGRWGSWVETANEKSVVTRIPSHHTVHRCTLRWWHKRLSVASNLSDARGANQHGPLCLALLAPSGLTPCSPAPWRVATGSLYRRAQKSEVLGGRRGVGCGCGPSSTHQTPVSNSEGAWGRSERLLRRTCAPRLWWHSDRTVLRMTRDWPGDHARLSN